MDAELVILVKKNDKLRELKDTWCMKLNKAASSLKDFANRMNNVNCIYIKVPATISVYRVFQKYNSDFVKNVQNSSSIIESKKFELMKSQRVLRVNIEKEQNQYSMLMEDAIIQESQITTYKNTILRLEFETQELGNDIEVQENDFSSLIQNMISITEKICTSEHELKTMTHQLTMHRAESSRLIDSIHEQIECQQDNNPLVRHFPETKRLTEKCSFIKTQVSDMATKRLVAMITYEQCLKELNTLKSIVESKKMFLAFLKKKYGRAVMQLDSAKVNYKDSTKRFEDEKDSLEKEKNRILCEKSFLKRSNDMVKKKTTQMETHLIQLRKQFCIQCDKTAKEKEKISDMEQKINELKIEKSNSSSMLTEIKKEKEKVTLWTKNEFLYMDIDLNIIQKEEQLQKKIKQYCSTPLQVLEDEISILAANTTKLKANYEKLKEKSMKRYRESMENKTIQKVDNIKASKVTKKPASKKRVSKLRKTKRKPKSDPFMEDDCFNFDCN